MVACIRDAESNTQINTLSLSLRFILNCTFVKHIVEPYRCCVAHGTVYAQYAVKLADLARGVAFYTIVYT